MTSDSSILESDSNGFRLHFIQDHVRCVVTYDTLEAALQAAFRKLRQNPKLELWISDSNKEVLLDASQIRARLRESGPDD